MHQLEIADPWWPLCREFEQDGRDVRVRVESQLTFNSIAPILAASLSGLGSAYLPNNQVQPYVDAGKLVQTLEAWTPPYPGYHLYYPSRRHMTPAFKAFVNAIKYRG